MGGAVHNVVFDIGGVLLDWNPQHLYRDLISDDAERKRFLDEVCTMEWNSTLDRGRPFDEACAELAVQHPDQAELIYAWKRQDDMIAGEVPGTAALVDALRARSRPLYLLTNMPADVFEDRHQRFAVLHRFEGAVVSGQEGLLKPEPEIFALLAERFGLEPAATLFIDDSELNVDGARAAGFEAHRFVDAAGLAGELSRRGLLPSESGKATDH